MGGTQPPLQHSTKLPAMQVCIDDFPGKSKKNFHRAARPGVCRKSCVIGCSFVQKRFSAIGYLVDIGERRRFFEGKQRKKTEKSQQNAQKIAILFFSRASLSFDLTKKIR
ncbi:MAG: hypothetical protein IIY93_09195 [Clostridia bacterium]|nr:hypothetical protein [Clostridia bacterium]